jgi:hypothetical protein
MIRPVKTAIIARYTKQIMPTPSHRPLLLALDQGTTSSRAMLFDRTGAPVSIARRVPPDL